MVSAPGKVRASAPGKVHIIGEHAVVYGKPAIIAAIGKRCFAEAAPSDGIRIESRDLKISERCTFDEVIECTEQLNTLWLECFGKGDFSRLFVAIRKDDTHTIRAVVGKILEQLSIKSGVSVRIQSDIPLGSGLGSGAALSVALSKAIAGAHHRWLSKEKINATAYEVEKFLHGTPSGGDNAACCYGGVIWFEKGGIRKLGRAALLRRAVLVHTGKPELTTGELVQRVRNLPEPRRTKRVDRIGELAHAARKALHAGNQQDFMQTINEAQQMLRELGVSTKRIDSLAESVKDIGGAAKLCGAGGGGVVLCCHRDKALLRNHLIERGYQPIEPALGAEGVRAE